MTTRELLNASFNEIKKNFIYYFVAVGIMVGLDYFLPMLRGGDIIYIIISVIFTPFIILEFYHAIKENRKPDFINMIKINNDRPIMLNLLETLFIILWMLLLIVPGVIKALSYRLALKFVSEDDNIGYMEALKKSQQEMTGLKTPLFFTNMIISLPSIVLYFIGLLAFGEVYSSNGFSIIYSSPVFTGFLSFIKLATNIVSFAVIPVFYAKFDEMN